MKRHKYQLYLALDDIDHTKTKVKKPQTNGICERFQKTALAEFYRVTFRRKIYWSLGELRGDLDTWLDECNTQRAYHGKRCVGKTAYEELSAGKAIVQEKQIAA